MYEDDRCECGWELPSAVGAFPAGVAPAPDKFIVGSYVAIKCPVCNRGHAFVNELDDSAASVMHAAVVRAKKKVN